MARNFNTTSKYGSATAATGSVNNLSLFAWFKAPSFTAYDSMILCRDEAFVGLTISGGQSNALAFSWNADSNDYNFASDLILPTDTWILGGCCVDPDGTTVYMYVPGEELSSSRLDASQGARSFTNWAFTRDPLDNSRGLNGILGPCGIWTSTLTLTQVQALTRTLNMASVASGSLLDHWPMLGVASPEPGVNGHNMTLTGSPAAVAGPVLAGPELNTKLAVATRISL